MVISLPANWSSALEDCSNFLRYRAPHLHHAIVDRLLDGSDFSKSLTEAFYPVTVTGMTPVSEPQEIIDIFKESMNSPDNPNRSILLLSGGIDSAILAACMDRGRDACAIVTDCDASRRDAYLAREYAYKNHLRFREIHVSSTEYEAVINMLIGSKKGPLHPLEPLLFVALSKLRNAGFYRYFTGFGADLKFGGLTRLLSVDYIDLEHFCNTFMYVDPAPLTRSSVLAGDYIDMPGFKPDDAHDIIDWLHGESHNLAMQHVMSLCNGGWVNPYVYIKPATPITAKYLQENGMKPLLVETFKKLYPHSSVPEKVTFPRPLDLWYKKDWAGPFANRTNLFITDKVEALTGEQRFMVDMVDRFLWLFRLM